MASSCSGVSRLPNAGMSVSGLTASGSAIQLRSVGASCLVPMCDSSGPSDAAVAVDDVAADAVARPHPGRALDRLRIARIRLPRRPAGRRRRAPPLSRSVTARRRLAQARRDHLGIGHVARRAIPGRATSTPARADRPCRSPSGSARTSPPPRTAARRSLASTSVRRRGRHRPVPPPERRQRDDARGHRRRRPA